MAIWWIGLCDVSGSPGGCPLRALVPVVLPAVVAAILRLQATQIRHHENRIYYVCDNVQDIKDYNYRYICDA